MEEEIGEKYDRKKVDVARKEKKNMNKMVKRKEKKRKICDIGCR